MSVETNRMLHRALACLLVGTGAFVAPAWAQDPASLAAVATDGAAVDCSDSECVSDEGAVIRIRTRGARTPVTEPGASGEQALAPDRRVSVQAQEPGKAEVIGQWTVQLPDGGVLWVTEDPNLGQPQFNVSAPSMLPFDGSRITEPVRFHVFNNYPAFIERSEVLIFRAIDVDLLEPVATVPLANGGVSETLWDGVLPDGQAPRLGDELVYIVRAHGANGAVDETFPRRMQLVKPEDVERGRQRLQNVAEKSLGTRLDADEAERRSLVEASFGENTLRQQNIPIYGSRVRIQGRNLPENAQVSINGQNQPLDLERKLVAEFLVPVGKHAFEVKIGGGAEAIVHTLDVDVTGKYLFAVALADVTASGSDVTGSIEPLAGDERFDDSFILEGRLAFYLKAKIKGKYLVTAHADTQEREVSELFSGFWDADPQDIFRRLDPDAYYPVYGDDSVTYRDVDTQGRLYIRVDWDKNQALWGNFFTGVTGTEFGQYSRALYGAAVNWRSRNTTELGDPETQVRAFASEAQTAVGHGQFLGTGGSLYFLKHTDLLPGSDRVVLEVRDATTGRVENRIDLARGADYDIDEIQGRIILNRPLAQITRENLPTLTRDAPLDGYQQVLLVDYEYIPVGLFDAGNLTSGFRGRRWFGEHVAVGGTYVDENRQGDDYTLRGVDLTLQQGRGTFVRFEHSETKATSAPVFFSDNGGLSFTEVNAGLGPRSGDASAIEARANFKELGWTRLDWSAGAWWREIDPGFSISRADTGADIEEYGAEVLGQLTPDLGMYARFSEATRDAETLRQAQVTGEWRINETSTLSAELRQVDEDRLGGQAIGTLAALKYQRRISDAFDLYGVGQVTVDDDSGAYEDNDALTLGANYLFGDLSTLTAEVTTGDRGDAARLGAEYRLNPDHSIYGALTYSGELREYDPLFNTRQNTGWTLGQRWRLNNQVNMFNESQFLKAPQESGLAHTFGMDFYPGLGWNLGFTLQQAELDAATGRVDREAVSLSGGRTSNDTQWQSRLEWREDTGAERRTQWVSTNRVLHKLNEDFRVAARINYSETEDRNNAAEGAKFVESNLGFAWRPMDNTRWALLGKYTYLYDVSAFEQNGSNVAFYDQRSHVLSAEGIYKPSGDWEFAGKAMRREGEVRFGRLTGQWSDSAATFLAAQLRREIGDDWHALAEYRFLDARDGGTRQGALLGVDYDLSKHFRVGGGYNFTDFSDDLTNFDYDHKGWYLNFVGTY
jgi:hypothetical protein